MYSALKQQERTKNDQVFITVRSPTGGRPLHIHPLISRKECCINLTLPQQTEPIT